MAGCEIEEGYGWGVDMDVEAVLLDIELTLFRYVLWSGNKSELTSTL